MKKMMLLVCGMIFAASVFGGDFAKDFQSAINLYNGGKYPESEDAFVKLNEQNATPKGTDESHAYEDFEKWPDPMKYSAYVCRGNAYFRVKNAENAEKDFLAAMKNTVEKLDKAYVNMSLGNVYRDVGMDNQKAVDAYGEVYQRMTKNTAALSFYRKAAAVEKAPDFLVKEANQKIAESATLPCKHATGFY